jgi:predicted HAD superfamily phosphohydrolase YqeG
MTDFEQTLAELDSREIDYVFARSETPSDNAALELAGLSWGWLRNRDVEKLDDIAKRLQINFRFKARKILRDSLEKAATVKVKGLDSRDERLKQSVSTEILDRELGKPTVNIEQNTNESKEITVTIKRNND